MHILQAGDYTFRKIDNGGEVVYERKLSNTPGAEYELVPLHEHSQVDEIFSRNARFSPQEQTV